MTHPFEKTLGPGPYVFTGMYSLIAGEKASCAHCGQAIINVFNIQTGEGKICGVGSDCIHKIGLPDHIMAQVKRAEQDHDRKLRNERKNKKINELRTELAGLIKLYGPNLAQFPHPRFSGKNLRDDAEWTVMNAKEEGLRDCILRIRQQAPNMATAAMSDGYFIAYGNTYGMNDKFNKLGFSLKKVEGTWLWFRETLSDKAGVWKTAIEAFGPGINTAFVKELDMVVECKAMDKEVKESAGEKELESHHYDGAVFEMTRWFALKFKEKQGTAYAFRNFRILKVKGESAKAYLVDAEFFSGIASTCGVCGQELNNDISRATGIGPVCARRIGLPRPTMAKAKLIVAELETLSKAQGTFKDVWIPKSQIKNITDKSGKLEQKEVEETDVVAE
jgi:hypothetical protein